jgi:hypothetical protein
MDGGAELVKVVCDFELRRGGAMGSSLNGSDCFNGEPNSEVIFSLMEGFVWASWPGAVSIVRVGRYQAVTASMRDFLAQCEVGERLAKATRESVLDRSIKRN